MSTQTDSPDEGTLRNKPSAFVKSVVGADPFWYQEDIMDADSDRKVFRAGRQVGKSRVASWIGLHQAVTNSDVDVLITADAQRQSSELFAQVKKEMSMSNFTEDDWGVTRDTATMMEFDNGSRIICLPTGRDGKKIRNYAADLIIVDEAAFIDDTIYEDVLEPMTFVTDGTMILCSTPWGQSGYFYDKANHPDWYEVHVSSYDNPEISDEKIETFKEGKSHATIQQEVEGKFVPEADNFFDPDLVRDVVGTEDGTPVRFEGEEVYLGVDPADSGMDDTALVLMDDDGNVFDIEHHQQMKLHQGKERIKALDRNYNFDEIVMDKTGLGKGPVRDLEHKIGSSVKGIKFTVPKKQDMYQTLKFDMEQDNLTIQNHDELRTQLNNMTGDKTRSGRYKIHAGSGSDDLVDALVLANYHADTEGSRGMARNAATGARFMGSLREL